MASTTIPAASVGVSAEDLELADKRTLRVGCISLKDHEDYSPHSDADVMRAQKTIHSLRRREVMWLGLVAVLVCSMFCTSIMAIYLTKDMHVEDSRLVDAQGSEVFTRNQIDTIEGVHLIERRRLEDNSVAEDGAAMQINSTQMGQTVMEVKTKQFHRVRRAYIKGQPQWVVAFPGDISRTVSISGFSGTKAWGMLGDCVGSMVWVAACTPEAEECQISWWRVDPQKWMRQLGEANDVESVLRARAEASKAEGGISMERSLSGKQCC